MEDLWIKVYFRNRGFLYLTKQVWIWQYFQSMLYRHNLFPSTCVIKGLVKGRSYTCVGKTLALKITLEESGYQTDLCLPSVFSNWTRLPPLLLWKHCFFSITLKIRMKACRHSEKKTVKKVLDWTIPCHQWVFNRSDDHLLLSVM